MRIFRSIGLAFAACLSVFSFTAIAEPLRAIDYVSGIMLATGEPQGVALARLELTLAQWRTGVGAGSDHVASNLIALSNHFGLSDAAPFGVPDWDQSASA